MFENLSLPLVIQRWMPQPRAVSSPSNDMQSAERDFILAIYRKAVDYYQPKIEKRTGILLGNVTVHDLREYPAHRVNDLNRKAGLIESLWWWDSMRRWKVTQQRRMEQSQQPPTAAYWNGRIYISFYGNHIHEDCMAEAVVHELSHALWDRVEQSRGIDPSDFREHPAYRVFQEGHATYLQKIGFVELYPYRVRKLIRNVRNNRKTDSVYCKGFDLVTKLVAEHGPEILMELPVRWPEFTTREENNTAA